MEHIWEMHIWIFKADIYIPCLKYLQGNEFRKINICSMALLLIFYKLNVCVPPSPNSYVEVLISNVVAFGGEAFGKKLGLEEVIKVGSSC